MKYKRILFGSILGGVLSGFAYYFKIPTWILRTSFVLLVITEFAVYSNSVFWLVYVLIALFAPEYKEDPLDYKEVCE